LHKACKSAANKLSKVLKSINRRYNRFFKVLYKKSAFGLWIGKREKNRVFSDNYATQHITIKIQIFDYDICKIFCQMRAIFFLADHLKLH